MRTLLIGTLGLVLLLGVGCKKPPEATQAVSTSPAAGEEAMPVGTPAPSGQNAPASAQQQAATLPPGVNRDHP